LAALGKVHEKVLAKALAKVLQRKENRQFLRRSRAPRDAPNRALDPASFSIRAATS